MRKRAKYASMASLTGAAGKLSVALSWDEMRQIAREDHAEAMVAKLVRGDKRAAPPADRND